MSRKKLLELFNDLVAALSAAIQKDDCPAATRNVARQLLKDNGVKYEPALPSLPSLEDLDESKLPTFN